MIGMTVKYSLPYILFKVRIRQCEWYLTPYLYAWKSEQCWRIGWVCLAGGGWRCPGPARSADGRARAWRVVWRRGGGRPGGGEGGLARTVGPPPRRGWRSGSAAGRGWAHRSPSTARAWSVTLLRTYNNPVTVTAAKKYLYFTVNLTLEGGPTKVFQ